MFGFTFEELSVHLLTIPLVLIFVSNLIISYKTRFIQFRMIPRMMRLFVSSIMSKQEAGSDSIPAHKALFTAMSTTIGIGNIVGPLMAIRLGGPGALLIFLVALVFGAATTYAEVAFAMSFRKKLSSGFISGGPMQYLQDAVSPVLASIYAFFGALMLVAWSSNQSNTLGDIFETHGVSEYITGGVIAIFVCLFLIAGIKSIGNLASKIVPFMFLLYCGASLWVVFANIEKLPGVISLIFASAFSFKAASGASMGLVIRRMFRWGLAKGIQAGEAGVGSAAIPHSKSSGDNAQEQGILAMVSVYSVAFVCMLSGLVTLLTGTWNDQSVRIGINMISVSFAQYFPYSSVILACCATLFALGTILGNSYNGSQCFLYLTKNRWLNWYFALVGIVVFVGTISDVQFIWNITDFFIIPVAIANLIGLLWLTFKRSDLLKI